MHVATVLPGLGSEPRWRSLHARRLLQGARAGRLNCRYRYISDGKVFLLHRSALN